jgi:hypothetical protein
MVDLLLTNEALTSELLQYYEERKDVKVILVYLESDVDCTENDGGYKQYETSLIYTQLVFIVL